MIGVFVTFRYGDNFDGQAVRKNAETARARFEGMPGLRSKTFTANSGKREATNFCVWDSEDAAKAFFADALLERVTGLYGVRPSVEFVQIATLAKRDYERTIADCTQAIRLDPDAYHYRKRGRAYEEMKDYDKAIADFGEAIRLDPKDPYSYDLRADSYKAKAKRFRAKAARYKKARSARARTLRKKYIGRAAAAHKNAQADLETAKELRNQK
jgi:tetratricopeptide (TPR) repeat protein